MNPRTRSTAKMKAMSRLTEKLASGRLSLTAACLPPQDADPASVRKLAAYFPPAIDSVVVADNPHRARGSALACAALLATEKIEPMLSLVTRDRNRIALESDVLGATALGVKSFLCLTGAHQTLGASAQAAGAFDVDSVQLCQGLARLTGEGIGFEGNKLSVTPIFGIAASVHPYLRPLELAVLQTRKKVVAGAQVLLTDPIFDLPGFEAWMKAIRATGLEKRAAIIASVLPLSSVPQAESLKERPGFAPIPDDVIAKLKAASDVPGAGIAIVADIAARLKAVPGVRGIHILSDGCEAMVGKIIQEARLA
jgi:methylenetetrahydrofolate reductase (NADPH)